MKTFTIEGKKITLYEATGIAKENGEDEAKREKAIICTDIDGKMAILFEYPMPETEEEFENMVWNGDWEEAGPENHVNCLDKAAPESLLKDAV